jgi:hypothetical protein
MHLHSAFSLDEAQVGQIWRERGYGPVLGTDGQLNGVARQLASQAVMLGIGWTARRAARGCCERLGLRRPLGTVTNTQNMHLVADSFISNDVGRHREQLPHSSAGHKSSSERKELQAIARRQEAFGQLFCRIGIEDRPIGTNRP